MRHLPEPESTAATRDESSRMSQPTGIPRIERWIGRLLIARWCRRNPPRRTVSLLREQQAELVSLVKAAGPRATTRIQIRRLPGLENSSTNYSLAMVVDHLARVNRDLASTLESLALNQPGKITVVIANYKPDPGAQAEQAMADLDASIAALEHSLADTGKLERSTQTHAHPWFGELPATTWACFAPFHQSIHLKQARLIAAALQSTSRP